MTKQTTDQSLREQLAAIEHQRWADWQSWCHKILRENCPSPELEKVLERWDRQIATPYDELSEAEKASDMEQVDRYWPLIAHHTTTAIREARIDLLEEILSADDSGDFISQMAHAVGAVGRMYQDLQSHPTSTKDAA